MRRLLIVILALALPVAALAGDSRVKRAYHLDRSGIGSSNLCDTTIGCPTLGIWFDDAVAATYTTEIGSYVMTVNGNPTRVAAGTWPAGFSGSPGYAWRMDGTGDYLSIADAVAFEPTDFSVFACFVPRSGIAANDVYIAKSVAAGNQYSWKIHTPSDAIRVSLLVSDDGSLNGGHTTTLSKSASTSANRLSCFTVAYDYVSDGSSIANIWVDELAVATSSAMDGPLFNSTAPLTIGSDGAGSGDIPAEFYVLGFYPGALVEADHLMLARRYRGLFDSSATNRIVVADNVMPAIQVAPPDSGVSPFIVNMPANTSMIGSPESGSGGVYGASAITNKCWRSSFETGAALTGWTVANGGTTGACAQSCLSPAHGSCEAACSTADADDEVTLTSGCATVTGGTDMWVSAWLKTSAGAGLVDINIIEDDSADCGSPTTTTTVVNDAVPTATWGKQQGGITLQAGTIRAQVQISLPAAAAQTTFADAVQYRAGTYAIDGYCGADTDADVSCSTMVVSTADNGMISANGSAGITAVLRTPYSGSESSANNIFITDGNAAAANTIRIGISESTDDVYFVHYDSSAAAKEIAPNYHEWTANDDHTVKLTWDGNGALQGLYDGSWRLVTSGAGTGKRTASQASLYISGSNAGASDVWIRDLTVYRGMIDVGLYHPLMVSIGDSISQRIYEDLASLYTGTCFLNSGIGGNGLDTTLARFQRDALAYGPVAIYLHVGVNDVVTGRSAADMKTNMEAIGLLCDAAGTILIVDNIGTNTAYTAPQLAVLADYNSWLATTFAAAHPTAIVLDFLTWAENGSADPTVCNGAWFDAACVHPNSTGNPLWAAIVKAAYP